jgi:hypothetical protein
MGFGDIPYFRKMDSLHVKQLMFHPLDWEWVQCNHCNEVAHMFKGCETVVVVEQYAQEMVGMWD